MNTRIQAIVLLAGAVASLPAATADLPTTQVRTPDGVLEGVISPDGKVRTFKGVPFAAPPVGPLRWKEPQPVAPWTGVRKAADFGARCVQGNVFGDMGFRDNGPSEDCLYLNLWMPATASASSKLPVMVWVYGGGFAAGATSEARQDGGQLSKKGVIVVSMNYRLGIFGFFTHPDLSKESGHNASGNYGLMDQAAALRWVHRNIALFGGDPDNVTIFGESAGSFSVSALMASPLSKDLVHRAIGESGAFFSASLASKPLADAEAADVKFAQASLGTSSLEALRAKPAQELLDAAMKTRNAVRFSAVVDGYFLPANVPAIYAAGKQAHIDLLAGWNADEGNYRGFFGADPPTPENYAARAEAKFGKRASEFLKVYPGGTAIVAKRSAQDLAGDQFIAYGTWRWLEAQLKTGEAKVYRYKFEDAPPGPGSEESGAYHSAEIEFVFDVLSSKNLPWRPQDRKLSDLMATYWSNFAKTGDPNGEGLPKWPAYNKDSFEVMHLNADSKAEPDTTRARYLFLETLDSQ
jgi:para-nitrobenzyl esterase